RFRSGVRRPDVKHSAPWLNRKLSIAGPSARADEGSLLPGRKRGKEVRIGPLVEHCDKFQRMTIGVGKVDLRGGHPADDGLVRGLVAKKISCMDAKVIQPAASGYELRQ